MYRKLKFLHCFQDIRYIQYEVVIAQHIRDIVYYSCKTQGGKRGRRKEQQRDKRSKQRLPPAKGRPNLSSAIHHRSTDE